MYDLLCADCKDIKDRKEFEGFQEEERKEYAVNPLLSYADKIRGEISYYDGTFKEYKKRQKARDEATHAYLKKIDDKIFASPLQKPECMTKKEWERKQRHRRRLGKEQMKERKANNNLKYHNSPATLLENRIRSVHCKCEGELMRQSVFWVLVCFRVNDYMLSLFKEAAERRHK